MFKNYKIQDRLQFLYMKFYNFLGDMVCLYGTFGKLKGQVEKNVHDCNADGIN